MGMCDSHLFVPEFSPKGQMALHPPYNRVKAIGAIASHQLWTIGVVALPHTSHTVCTPAEVSSRRGAHAGERGGGGENDTGVPRSQETTPLTRATMGP